MASTDVYTPTEFSEWSTPSFEEPPFESLLSSNWNATASKSFDESSSLFSYDTPADQYPIVSGLSHPPASFSDHYFVVTYLSWRSLKSDLKKSVIVSRGTNWSKVLDYHFWKGERILILFYIKSRKRFYGYGRMTSYTREFMDRKGFTFDLEVLTLYNCDNSDLNPFLPWLRFLKNGNEPIGQDVGTILCGIIDHIFRQKDIETKNAMVEKMFQSLQYSFQAWYGNVKLSPPPIEL